MINPATKCQLLGRTGRRPKPDPHSHVTREVQMLGEVHEINPRTGQYGLLI